MPEKLRKVFRQLPDQIEADALDTEDGGLFLRHRFFCGQTIGAIQRVIRDPFRGRGASSEVHPEECCSGTGRKEASGKFRYP